MEKYIKSIFKGVGCFTILVWTLWVTSHEFFWEVNLYSASVMLVIAGVIIFCFVFAIINMIEAVDAFDKR